jgi:hypothetical protein
MAFTGMFWLQFAITEALNVAKLFVAASPLGPNTKTAFDNFITAGQGLILALSTPNA